MQAEHAETFEGKLLNLIFSVNLWQLRLLQEV